MEDAKKRCHLLISRLTNSNNDTTSINNLSTSSKSTLLRLINSELNFLNRSHSPSPLLSFNIGYLEAVVHVLSQPFVAGVSRVCKPIRLSPLISIHVDIICSLNGSPVWFIVSDRNPKYISWECGTKDKGLKSRIEQVVCAARIAPIAIRPCSVVLFYASGLRSDLCEKVMNEFGGTRVGFVEGVLCEEVELEDGWVSVERGRLFSEGFVVEIKVGEDDGEVTERDRGGSLGCGSVDGVISCKRFDEYCGQDLGTSLRNLINAMGCWCCDGMRLSGECETKLVNFDTTAMVAIVSGISNDGTEKILATSERELRGRFKGNYEFVIAQVTAEKQNPILVELFDLSRKRGIICESAHSEFQDLISMVGGPSEKLRAAYLLKFLKLVPDCPSARLMSLPTTRNLALKNKVIFGTGDYWNAPTVTANMAFVRAVEQAGVSLSVIKHRPRALVGH